MAALFSGKLELITSVLCVYRVTLKLLHRNQHPPRKIVRTVIFCIAKCVFIVLIALGVVLP